MTIVGAIVLIAGAVYSFMLFAKREMNLMTPEIYLAGVAAIVGAILCVVGEISSLRATIVSQIVDEPEEETATKTDSAKEE